MPKTKLQEVVFTILMVFVMVYAMICYNIALNMGGMSNIVFLNAFHELVIMGPIAFILDFFLYGSLSKKLAFRIVTPGVDKPIMIILAISSITVCLMCPTMSFFATLLFKSDRSVASDNSTEFPNGIFLADLFCRSACACFIRNDFQGKRTTGHERRSGILRGRRSQIILKR